MHNDAMSDLAALYALGELEPEEAREFESHLKTCADCEFSLTSYRDAAAALAFEVEPVAPPAALRRRIMAAVEPPPSYVHVVRAADGEWKNIGSPGIQSKILFYDREKDLVTTLVRMAPGATIASHKHSQHEQCVVLEGDIHSKGVSLRAGDYQCAFSGSVHDPIWTENGCLILLISSPHDEPV
ncbi:MAG: cupin domain-containing protein [Bryobacteraceae bacterium]